MPLSLLPTADDVRTNTTFEELMWALSRPGLTRTVPGGGFKSAAESVLDRECTFHVVDNAELDRAVATTGARRVSLAKAEYVFTLLASAEEVANLSALRVGSLAYPDTAATVFSPAKIGSGQQLKLSGPGIKGSVTIAVDGINPSFWPMRERSIRYPLGWDLYLLDGDRVVGLPRSTNIEVL
ncbi:alpha-D-ribose 1-methylphosphonate 5-triphosphate synthase subunit PhnH [Ensifer sp. SEMIA 135]|uniref:phosphonate C-P lyase system protein PhnH n=1 Tax=Rhizobium meliloti TaxID=382 RepID=UPI000FD86B31|nr:phosphonate C-P lyase system protein PhnH [Sinorhizobium meliloti]RVL21102.1 phosphonate C-P lyase system protein PhnH [Sinorhizobium meliloti]RVP94612.1 phosphonate C-P lyase system protein PhnH [Sinorhizobium meliloti]TWA88503.1 alpha-D-ribose 1-methylphosphonate 5-triphosphate synthase subunit PhnH [Ensifer sp. SEMIA 134]TWB24037.1 alpha-D-ribose 1-methylphosphonate 5-triphosphate synthase subunit PhnH [Ensifer sp. SEMIA 135]